ncbi:MAG: hypothetical protein M0T72_06865 [Candidatus Dormibacteraeota bacterium]|jgi:hypothetical protein|nr:hypothetical protein [Candidatus Dormibacteraeota bacterium]
MRPFGHELSWGRSEILVLALFALSVADMVDGGYASWPAFAALALALLLLGVAMLWHHSLSPGFVPWTAAPAFAVLMLLFIGDRIPMVDWTTAVTAALAITSGVTSHPVVRRLTVSALLLTWLVTVSLWIALMPIHIDVLSVLHGGATRLLHGLDPYTGHYTSTTPGVRTVPYDYSPATVLLAAPAALLGHVRYTNATLGCVSLLALSTLAVRNLASTSTRSFARIVPVSLCVPLMTLVIWAGWTDVYMLAPFSLWLLWRAKHPVLGTGCLAVALGSTFLITPFLVPLFLWSPTMRRELILAALASLGLIYLPFVAWAGPSTFFHDLVGFYIGLPTIPHSLALQSLLAYFGLPGPNLVVTAVILGLAAIALTLWQPTGLSDLLLAAAAFGFVAFLVNRWAFFDYWALVAYVLLAALATTGMAEEIALPIWWLVGRRWFAHRLPWSASGSP